jgi:hypothetical protein
MIILSVFDIISLEALAICAPSLKYLSVSFSILKIYIKVKVVCFRGRKMTTALFFFFFFLISRKKLASFKLAKYRYNIYHCSSDSQCPAQINLSDYK